jgi:N-acetylmuramic acid 6-phosphate etherase
MLTEQQNPKTAQIDQATTLDALTVMSDEDATVAHTVRAALPAIAQAVDAISARLARGARLIYVGAGTSGRLGVLDAVECVPTFGVPPGVVIGLIAGGSPALTAPVEGAEDDSAAGAADLRAIDLAADDAVVGIAASGRTPYVLGALEYANGLGALTVGVSCNVPAPLLDAAQIAIPLPVGPEVITGSTRLKAGTAQKLTLNMLSTVTMVRLGKVYGNLMVDVQTTNAKLVDRARRIIAQVGGTTPEAAAELLETSGREVKTAIVMARRGVDADEARRLLALADGRLRGVIGA